MKNIDSYSHVTGKSVYVDDVPIRIDTLYAVVFGSEIAHGTITSIDTKQALELSGVEKIIFAKDIPGENEIGGIIKDEPLLCDKLVHFKGQPIAVIVAKSELIGRKARKLIHVTYKEEEAITDPRFAYEKGLLIHPPRTFQLGDVDSTWDECDFIIEGKADSGGQEHLYIETQGSYAFPIENGAYKVISSTQGPTVVQRTITRILNIPMHKIEVEVRRLGGAFGGKEDQATSWACMATLACFLLQRPVKLILHRLDDIAMTGKRHPYSSDYKLGLLKNGLILALEVKYYQNGGAHADLSPAILVRTLSHATNSYFIPNVKATAFPCKTNLIPNTAFRGFGGPQAMFVMESAIVKASETLQIDPDLIQELNLLNENDQFPYGQIASNPKARDCWSKVVDLYQFQIIKTNIKEFNETNFQFKKGYYVMPVCFGISFNKTFMNQAGALVHIYQDGSIGVSTGAVEMGQGVNTRILQVPIRVFSVNSNLVKIETTNTTRVANTSPSAASSTADLNGKATLDACNKLLTRLINLIKELKGCKKVDQISFKDEFIHINGCKTDLDWKTLITKAFLSRVDLSAHGFYATPEINFNEVKEKGEPFSYHAYGSAIIEVTVDCLRGIYIFDRVSIVHDYGKSMNKHIDIGQTEGGLVQGIGWMTSEEISYDDSGTLMSNSLSTYKVPDVQSVPKEIKIHFLENSDNEFGLFKSKAIGEPPLMYGIGAYFAIKNAIKSFNPSYNKDDNAPFTPEKVLMALYDTED